MSLLAQLLADVLSGRRLVSHPSTFRLLRKFAPQEAAKLNELEAIARKAEDGSPPEGDKNEKVPADTLRLTRHDLEEILGGRATDLAEVEWLLAHGTNANLQLTAAEERELRSIATRLYTDHFGNARGVDHSEEFIARTIGTFRTRYGDLSRAEVAQLEAIRVQAAHAIHDCPDHEHERCTCWRDARGKLGEIRRLAGAKSALGIAALAVWNSIENLGRSRQKDSPKAEEGPSEGPPGILFNWRHFRSPDYVDAVLQQ